MTIQRFHVITLGEIARQVLAENGPVILVGTSSHGAFLRSDAGRIVFLSADPERGPLTLNVRGLPAWKDLPAGIVYTVQENHARNGSEGIVIDLSTAQTWLPEPISNRPSTPIERQQRLRAVAVQVFSQRAGEDQNSLLHAAIPLLDETGSLPLPALGRFSQAIRERQTEAVAVGLESFYGLGAGLTPSGDDLIIGVLLTLNRWGAQLDPEGQVWREALNRRVIQTAWKKTTAVSASLIECAARGQADERLITALDGIVTGYPDVVSCAAGLLAWGSHSGADTLAGMILAIRSYG